MSTIQIKNGVNVTLREAENKDAKEIIDFYNVVSDETTFLSFGKGEYNVTVEQQESSIISASNSDNNIMILAIADSKIVGIGTISSNQKKKGKHVGVYGIVIKQEYCNLGLGYIMTNYLLNWCRENNITKKVSLVTSAQNPRAIALYKKCGFEIEGTLKNEVCIDGELSDLIAMGITL